MSPQNIGLWNPMELTLPRPKGLQQTRKSLLKGLHADTTQGPAQKQPFKKHPDFTWKIHLLILKHWLEGQGTAGILSRDTSAVHFCTLPHCWSYWTPFFPHFLFLIRCYLCILPPPHSKAPVSGGALLSDEHSICSWPLYYTSLNWAGILICWFFSPINTMVLHDLQSVESSDVELQKWRVIGLAMNFTHRFYFWYPSLCDCCPGNDPWLPGCVQGSLISWVERLTIKSVLGSLCR